MFTAPLRVNLALRVWLTNMVARRILRGADLSLLPTPPPHITPAQAKRISAAVRGGAAYGFAHAQEVIAQSGTVPQTRNAFWMGYLQGCAAGLVIEVGPEMAQKIVEGVAANLPSLKPFHETNPDQVRA